MPTIPEALAAAEAANAPEPEVAPDQAVGQGAEGAEPTTEPSYFDPTEFADRKARVKVGDEELEVPVPELVQGYMRQADYTRKTQAAAEQAKQAEAALALQRQLQSDPAGTIQQLALRQLQAQASQQEQEPTDPVQAKLQALEQRINQYDALEQDRYLARELAQLKSEFGDHFDPEAVVGRAYSMYEQTGYLPDPRSAYFQMLGEQAWAQQDAQREFTDQNSAADAAALAAKREASQLSGGHSAQGAGGQIQNEELSVAEAFRRAQEIHGPLTFG